MERPTWLVTEDGALVNLEQVVMLSAYQVREAWALSATLPDGGVKVVSGGSEAQVKAQLVRIREVIVRMGGQLLIGKA